MAFRTFLYVFHTFSYKIQIPTNSQIYIYRERESLSRLWFSLGIESHPAVSAKEWVTNWDVTVYLAILKWRASHRIGLVYKDNFVSSLNWSLVEVLLKDTLVSGQLYLQSPSENFKFFSTPKQTLYFYIPVSGQLPVTDTFLSLEDVHL